jgi:hypothetical protein
MAAPCGTERLPLPLRDRRLLLQLEDRQQLIDDLIRER